MELKSEQWRGSASTAGEPSHGCSAPDLRIANRDEGRMRSNPSQILSHLQRIHTLSRSDVIARMRMLRSEPMTGLTGCAAAFLAPVRVRKGP
ncbi:MAG: hypothetical protein JKY94_02285 [Rhodobacteraceae bacterium]|nr:hypothetical protein [Paracoccaceae bacterium]